MHQNLVSWSIEKGARRQSSSAWLVDKHYIDGLPLACSCVTILVCSTLSGEKNPHNLVPKKPVLVIFFFSLALLNNFHDPTSFHLQLINYQFGVRWICMCSMTIKKLSPNLVLHAQFPSYFKRVSNFALKVQFIPLCLGPFACWNSQVTICYGTCWISSDISLIMLNQSAMSFEAPASWSILLVNTLSCLHLEPF